MAGRLDSFVPNGLFRNLGYSDSAQAYRAGLLNSTDQSQISKDDSGLLSVAKQKLNDITGTYSRAASEAERRFPNQDPNNTQKNAFRHALGSGYLAQQLGAGGNPIMNLLAQGLAQGAGHAWEAMSLPQNMADPVDMRHDLNNNYIGIKEAASQKDFDALSNQLYRMAIEAKKEQPPGAFSPARPYMTYTE